MISVQMTVPIFKFHSKSNLVFYAKLLKHTIPYQDQEFFSSVQIIINFLDEFKIWVFFEPDELVYELWGACQTNDFNLSDITDFKSSLFYEPQC